MNIVQISIEFAPIIKVGGLGDMVSSLSTTLSKHHNVEVIIPYIPFFSIKLPKSILCEKTFPYTFLGQQEASAYSYTYGNLLLTCIKLSSQPSLFDSTTVYTCNDAVRFCSFASAAAAYIKQNPHIDVVHIHDWHVGLIPGLIQSNATQTGRPAPKCMLTIHNFNYQGLCNIQILKSSNIDQTYLCSYQTEQGSLIANLMQGAIACSDYITTVSPSYAQEILEEQTNQELHQSLINKAHVFSGILNGIDMQVWNPETDPKIASHYNKNLSIQQVRECKQKNKQKLFNQLNISNPVEAPCLCVISRLEEQKGVQFMKLALLHAIENNYTFILIGTSLNQEIQQQFVNIQTCLSSSANIRIVLQYDESLARLTYAAADMICIPSLFEPCGLTQLIAMRYGTIPIVRSTGGLADTITPLVNGFSFSDIKDPQEFMQTLSHALNLYQHHPQEWEQLIFNGMITTFDAESMTNNYIDIYQNMLDHS